MQRIEKNIFNIQNDIEFSEIALEIFNFQAANCKIYNLYIESLGINIQDIKTVNQIPFLPIEFFKSHAVKSGEYNPEINFQSSGTTGMIRSTHYLKDLELYENSFEKGFINFYGPVEDYCVLALLPSYIEQENSSLVYMVKKLIEKTKNEHSGFYLYNHTDLREKLDYLESQNQKTILIGVSYALLDFTEEKTINLKSTIVMETGGMKGKRREITREELHENLKGNFNASDIHSEYGMTELLSQAFSKKDGDFITPPWMRILIRDGYDPFRYLNVSQSGGINIIDLANIYSCSFIETKDIGKQNPDESFKILGRFDNSDIRGCNLLTI